GMAARFRKSLDQVEAERARHGVCPLSPQSPRTDRASSTALSQSIAAPLANAVAGSFGLNLIESFSKSSRHTSHYTAQSAAACSNTSSSMRSVNFPVDVFCWLG